MIDLFNKNFSPTIRIKSPGRINLIGEHTDYNDGFVFPAAIDKAITFEFRKNHSKKICRIFSKDFDKYFEFELDKIEKSNESWENYLVGVVEGIQQKSNKLRGFDCIIYSDLPIGAGISSSAAMECGFGFGLNELFNLNLTKLDIIKIGQAAEHNFVGTQCGIMDQYASIMGKKNHAILLDCQSISHEYIPIELGDFSLLLLNTNVAHSLASSEYNTRRKECFEGVEIMKKYFPEAKTLRDLSLEDLNKYKSEFSKTVFDRCSYVLEENDRVLNAATALKENNLKAFGEHLYNSHKGLKNKYMVSCEELDFLVDFAQTKPYILGSRMMGGGFGGCTINLIHRDFTDAYIEEISKKYQETFNLELGIIKVHPSEGTSII